jgi:hypothetical protein
MVDDDRDTEEMELLEAEVLEDDEDEPDDPTLGQYLVENGVLSAQELREALKEQELQPGVRLAEIIAYLGYVPYRELDQLRSLRLETFSLASPRHDLHAAPVGDARDRLAGGRER